MSYTQTLTFKHEVDVDDITDQLTIRDIFMYYDWRDLLDHMDKEEVCEWLGLEEKK